MSNGQGPWGGSGGNSGGNGGDSDKPKGPSGRPPRRPDDIPDIDELMNRGREHLQGIIGGGGKPQGPAGGGRFMVLGGLVLAAVFWASQSVYSVREEERSVELFLGEFSEVGEAGLNFAPWPFVTKEIVQLSNERTINIGVARSGSDAGLMLTGDENIVDIDFQVVWNISDPQKYLFNLADPETTIEVVSESAMREIVAQSNLSPILNRDRGAIKDRLESMIQQTLDSYESGVRILRVNFDKADPPESVVAAFRDVQDAEQERDTVQNAAQAYANKTVAEARGNAARILENAEAYRARVVNEAEGEASRFAAVLEEYAKAPEVTRKRLYLETMEKVLSGIDLTILDNDSSAVPYLPLSEARNRGGDQ